MNILIYFSVLIFLWHFVACVPRATKYGAFVKQIECDSDDNVTSDRICSFRPMRNAVGNFSIGGTILYPANKAFLKMKTFAKSSSNRYYASGIDVDIDICKFTSSPLTIQAGKHLISSFWPEFLEKLGHLLHPCPYEGRVEFRNLIVDRIITPDFVATGDAKVIFRIYNPQNQTLFQITVLMYARSKSLMILG